MKRYYCMLLIFTACLIVAGCQRSGSGTQREPVPVKQEKDILPVPRENTLLFEARPLDRRYRLYVESMRKVEKELEGQSEIAKKNRWQGLAEGQLNLEAAKDPKPAATLKEARVQEDIAFEFDLFAAACLDFVKKKSPKDYSREEFTKYARRKEIIIAQKFLDKVDWVVATNEIPLTQYLEATKMIFVPQSDLNLSGGCIIAYHGSGDKDGNWVMMHDGEKMLMKMEAIKELVRAQELRVLRHHYLAFAAPHFLILPAAPQEEMWVKSFQVSPAGTIDSKLKLGLQQNTKYVKNPPDERVWLKFKKYMRETAPPPIYKDIVDSNFAVNLNALPGNRDMLGRDDPIACYAKESRSRPKDAVADLAGHWTVDMGGNVDLRPAAMVEFFLPKGKIGAKAP